MMWNQHQSRSEEEEIMDDFDLQGPNLKEPCEDLDKVNKWLGGNEITLEGVEKVIASALFSAAPSNS